MSKVLLEMSISMDGYVAGPHVSASRPSGEGGERLHEWMFEGRSEADSVAFENDYFADIGALIIGRRMADVGIGPWGEVPTFHAPCFVVTRRPHETIVKGRWDVLRLRHGRSRSRPEPGQIGRRQPGRARQRWRRRRPAVSQCRTAGPGAPPSRPRGAGRRNLSLFHGVWPSIGLTPVDVRAEPRVTHLTYTIA